MSSDDDFDPAADDRYDKEGGGEEGLPGGRIPNPPPRDAWVSRVVDDPANPPAAVLLSGYVGDAAEEGRTRIYSDASLGSYVDVQDEDVVHHEKLGGEQVPEGGSLVWVRADALVTPGAAGAGAGAAGGDFFTGPVLEQNRKAGTAGAAAAAVGPVQITLLTVAGCFTFGCPTFSGPCITRQPVLCSLVCQQGGGGPGPVGTWRDPEGTFACPPSIGCPTYPSPCGGGIPNPGEWVQRGAAQPLMAQQGPVGQTGWQGCGQPPIMTLPGCAHGPATNFQGCGQPGTIGFTGWLHCGHTLARVCTYHCQPPLTMGGICGPGPVSMHPGCPSPEIGAAGGGPIGQTGWQGCGQPGTAGPTGWLHCGHTLATVCTYHCEPPRTMGSPCGPGPVSMHPECPQAEGGGAGGGQVGQTGWLGCGQPGTAGPTGWLHCGHTLATVCTYHCEPPRTMGGICGPGPALPQTWGGICGIGPVSMHAGCPSPQLGAAGGGPIGQTGWQGCGQPLPRTWFATCGIPPVSMNPGCPPPQLGAAGGGPIGQTGWQGCGQPHISLPGCVHTGTCPQAEAVTGPGSTIATVCTHYLHCPPRTQNCTYDTVCTQIGCPPHTQNCTNATVCTQIDCPPAAARGAEQGAAAIPTGQYGPQCPTFGFTCTYVQCQPITIVTQGLGCPPTSTCPPTGGFGCPPETIVTRGFGCPPTSTCPPTGGFGCPPETIVTQGLGCPPTSTCPPTHAPGCGGTVAGGTVAAGPAAAAYTYYQGCPTFGFTCTYVHCPPA